MSYSEMFTLYIRWKYVICCVAINILQMCFGNVSIALSFTTYSLVNQMFVLFLRGVKIGVFLSIRLTAYIECIVVEDGIHKVTCPD